MKLFWVPKTQGYRASDVQASREGRNEEIAHSVTDKTSYLMGKMVTEDLKRRTGKEGRSISIVLIMFQGLC